MSNRRKPSHDSWNAQARFQVAPLLAGDTAIVLAALAGREPNETGVKSKDCSR